MRIESGIRPGCSLLRIAILGFRGNVDFDSEPVGVLSWHMRGAELRYERWKRPRPFAGPCDGPPRAGECPLMSYAALTTASRNPIKRFSHLRRFEIAMRLLALDGSDSIFDYGTGDGYVLALF